MKKLTIEWLEAAGVRAAKTFAQTAVGMVAVGAAFKDVDWINVLSVALVAAILSVLTSMAGLPEVSSNVPTSTAEIPVTTDQNGGKTSTDETKEENTSTK